MLPVPLLQHGLPDGAPTPVPNTAGADQLFRRACRGAARRGQADSLLTRYERVSPVLEAGSRRPTTHSFDRKIDTKRLGRTSTFTEYEKCARVKNYIKHTQWDEEGTWAYTTKRHAHV